MKSDRKKNVLSVSKAGPFPQEFLVLKGFTSEMIRQVELRRLWKDWVAFLYCPSDRLAQQVPPLFLNFFFYHLGVS